MPGVPFATLEAWAVVVAAMPRWDHTYAISSCGLNWGCWGRSSGGISIGSGIGSSIIADCLSQPNSQAGIRYGVTGVCHQTANRILHPAGPLTVATARGYPISVAVYGAYGIGPWTARSICYAPAATTPVGTGIASDRSAIAKRGDAVLSKDTYDQMVYRPRTPDDHDSDDEAVRLRELYALVQLGLGRALEPTTFRAIADRQAYMKREQAILAEQLESNKIAPEGYIDQLNRVLTSWADDTRGILGDKDFRAIFSESNPGGLVDRETFLAHRNEGAPRR